MDYSPYRAEHQSRAQYAPREGNEKHAAAHDRHIPMTDGRRAKYADGYAGQNAANAPYATPYPANPMPGMRTAMQPVYRRGHEGYALPLAMAWVEDQSIGEIYSPEDAMATGTLFPELDKPWLAGNGGR